MGTKEKTAPGCQSQGGQKSKEVLTNDVKQITPSAGSCQGTGNPLLDAALDYAARGWPIYPAREVSEALEAFIQRIKHLPEAEQKRKFRYKVKSPYIRDWNNVASTDPEVIRGWWSRWPRALLGLATGERVGLFVLDSDKPDGEDTVAAMAERLGPLPPTLTVRSGKGGIHRYFRWPTDGRIVRSREGHLGVNLDVRGHGGGIILPPSHLPVGFLNYEFVGDSETPIAEMPAAWLDVVAEEASVIRGREDDGVPLCELDQPENVERGRKYLVGEAPEAIQGTGQHRTTFAVAAKLRGFGLSQDMTSELMAELYNEQKCSPPWDLDALAYQVYCAFMYAKSPWGGDTPEGAFSGSPLDDETIDSLPKAKPDIIEKFNQDHAFTLVMGKPYVVRENILHDEFSDPVTFMTERGFRVKYDNAVVRVKDGDKVDTKTGEPKLKAIGVGSYWLKHSRRRTVEKIDFYPPPVVAPQDHMNLYRGASLTPTDKPHPERCARFVDLIQSHICNSDESLSRYVFSWIADLVQNPGKGKPGVCLVLRGGQGTGKGTFASHIMKLVSPYSIMLDKPDQLVGRFNWHMANKLLVVADEAFWAGDKSKVGPLKSFITEAQLSYEAKGRDLLMAKSYHRVTMLSNADWVVPADMDDRRFTVLDMPKTYAQDAAYFKPIWDEMANGGLEAFYRMMLDYDFSDVDIRKAPKTQGLLDQKLQSLDEIGVFVLEMLTEGRVPLAGSVEADTPWPTWVHKDALLDAFTRSLADDRKRYRPSKITFGRMIKKYIPGLNTEARGPADSTGRRQHVNGLPTLQQARADFDAVMGQPLNWPAA
ncbi:MAG: bifunctional DNA primase/polymerase [Solidesulfovibrio sp.]